MLNLTEKQKINRQYPLAKKNNKKKKKVNHNFNSKKNYLSIVFYRLKFFLWNEFSMKNSENIHPMNVFAGAKV